MVTERGNIEEGRKRVKRGDMVFGGQVKETKEKQVTDSGDGTAGLNYRKRNRIKEGGGTISAKTT